MFDNMNVNIMLNVQIVLMNNHDNIINMFQVNDHLNLLLLIGIILITCSLADATTDSINSSFIIADDDVIELLS